jgi:hypothetical protein
MTQRDAPDPGERSDAAENLVERLQRWQDFGGVWRDVQGVLRGKQ